jgi:hypothetical protein
MQHFSDTVRHHPSKVGRVPRGLFVRHRQKLRRLGGGLVVFAAALGVMQLLYPANRTLPFVAAGGQSVGNKSIQQVTATLDDDYKNAKLIVATDDKRFERPFSDLGATVRTKEAAQRAADYPFWQRLIPFSSFVIMTTRDTSVATEFDKARVKDFAEGVQKNSSTKAIDAKLRVKDGQVSATPSTPAKQYPVDNIIEAIDQATITPQTVARVTPRATRAALHDDEAAASVKQIQKLLDARMTIELDGRKKQVDSATLGSWLTFKPNAAKDSFLFSINPKSRSLTTYLQNVQGDSY